MMYVNGPAPTARATLSFLKSAHRPRYAMIFAQGSMPRIRQDCGPFDLAHSFAISTLTADESRRVAKACRNLVRPLTFTEGRVSWIDARAIEAIRLLLASYGPILGTKELGGAEIWRMYSSAVGSKEALQATDTLIDVELAKRRAERRWHADPSGRKWVLYTLREEVARSARFKIGVSRCVRARATALRGIQRCTVHVYACQAVAYAVEQGLHGLLYSFQHRRPRRRGVHGGDTEWYRWAAARLVDGASDFFSRHVCACVRMLQCGRRGTDARR